MKLIDKKTSAAVVTVTAALIIVVSGIGKYHANPFTFTYKTEKPIALVMSPSGSPSVIVDRNGTVMLIMDDSGKLQRTVKVNNADHPNDIISSIHVKQDTIYADVVTVENQHFVREQIRIYDKKGKCVRTVKDDSYTDGNVFCPQNQVFIRDGSNLSIIRIENNILKTILLGKESTMVTDSVCFSEPVIEAMQGRDSALYVSSLFGK